MWLTFLDLDFSLFSLRKSNPCISFMKKSKTVNFKQSYSIRAEKNTLCLQISECFHFFKKCAVDSLTCQLFIMFGQLW